MSNTKTDTAIAAGYTKAITAVETIEVQAASLRRSLKEAAEETSAFADARKREQDATLYELKRERQEQEDEWKREDLAREAAHKRSADALRDAEDELLGLLSLSRDPEGKIPTAKVIRTAFESHIARVQNTAEGKGRAMAKSEYETAKRIDDAEKAQASALINQKNTYLEQRNAALEKQNAELLSQSATNLDRMKDLASRGLEASAGIQAKANDAMATAAASAGGSFKR